MSQLLTLLDLIWVWWITAFFIVFFFWVFVFVYKIWKWSNEISWVDSIKKNIDWIRTDLVEIKWNHNVLEKSIEKIASKLDLMKFAESWYAQAQSPIALTWKWVDFVNELWIRELLDVKWDDVKNMFPDIHKLDNPLDIQEMSQKISDDVYDFISNSNQKSEIKTIVFKYWENSDIIPMLMWILIRDRVLNEKWISFEQLREIEEEQS